MATQGERIQQAYHKDEQLMDLYESYITRDTAKFDGNVKNLIDKITADLITDSNGNLSIEANNIEILDRVEDTVVEYLDSDNVEQLADDMFKTVELRIDTVNDLVKDAGLAGFAVDRPTEIPKVVDAIDEIGKKVVKGRDWSIEEFRSMLVQVRGDIQKGNLLDVDKFKQMLKTKGGVLPRYIKTVSDTQLSAIDRIIRREQAKQGSINTMKYFGPMDGRTRPFCAGQIGAIRSIEEWESMYNDTGPQPVIDYCGGWFCRHRLIVYEPEWDQ